MVEPQSSKLIMRVRFPSPAPLQLPCIVGTVVTTRIHIAHLAQSVEHFLGKEEVAGSIPVMSTNPPARAGGRIHIHLNPSGNRNGQGKVRAHQAARERGHDWPRGPWQDDSDGGADQDRRGALRRRVQGVRPDRRGAGREGARHHDLDGARGIRIAEPPLRARRLPGPRRLREEHDHGCGADGRRDPGVFGRGRPDAADARAHPAGPPGRRAVHRGLPEQGGPGGRRRAAGAGGDGSARAAVEVRLPGRRHPDHHRFGAHGAGRRPVGHRRAVDHQAGRGAGHAGSRSRSATSTSRS